MALQAVATVRARLGLALFLALVTLSGRQLTSSAAEPPPFAACTFGSASPLYVPMATAPGAILIDPGCQYAYLTNTAQNRLEIYSMQTQSFETPIAVGLSPAGMDFTPDGNRLYVANSGEHTISVIDLVQRLELRKINIPFSSDNDKPTRIAIGSAGNAIIVSFGCCSGKVYSLTLGNDAVTLRTDYATFGSASSNTGVAASGDRSAIVLTEGGTSAGTTRVYRSFQNAFDPAFDFETSGLGNVSVDQTASRVLIARGGYALVAGTTPLSLSGTITASSVFVNGGAGLHPTLPVAYRPADTKLEIYDLLTYQKIGERSIVNSISTANGFNSIGRVDVSDDGSVVGIITNNGFSLIRPFPEAPEQINLLFNGTFAAGLSNWTVAIEPGHTFLAGGVTGGVLEYNNLPGSQHVVRQQLTSTAPSSAPLRAVFRLGNSSSVDKTMTIGLSNSAGSDSKTCTFVVAPNSPLKTYTLVHRTTESWNGIVASVSADTVGADGGFNRVDNVSVVYDSTLSAPDGCSPPPPPTVGNCDTTLASPHFVPVAATFSAVLVDDACRYVYLLNKNQNRVDVYSLQTQVFESPIYVGSQPSGFDITPDGKTMYVANSAGSNISVVDLVQRVEDRKIMLAPESDFFGRMNMTARSVAVLNNGKAFVTTKSWCCTGPHGVQQLTLATDALTVRTNNLQEHFGAELARANGDRNTVFFLESGVSSGSIIAYQTSFDSFSPPQNLNTFIYDVATNRDGSRWLVNPGGFLVSSLPDLIGTFPAATSYGGAVHPTQALAYRSVGTTIQVLNTATRTIIGTLPLGNSVSSALGFNAIGRMDLSADGKVLAVITNNGFSIVRPFAAGPQVDLILNGSFSSGTSAWQTFATPDPSYLTGGVTGGVFEFNRVTPPPGTGNQALIFQETGVPLPAGAPIQAQFDLGNSSTVRKRLSVLLIDANFSDISVCTFWLPPNSALATYRMLAHTTKPWSNAAIYFYAATDGADGGFNRVDNVSLTFDPNLPNDRVACDDPTTPAAPGGPDGPNLIGNGDFTTGAPSPWLATDTLAWQITGGVFEFVRPTPTLPAGVVLQPTGQGVNAGDILTATFDLGNSSPARKRVTVLLHDLDFSDLSACTFWLPAGQPLSAYSMHSFATKAWTNATISIYAATVDNSSWVQLDNVTLRLTPGTAIEGTTCVEPDSGGAAPATSTTSPTPLSSARSESQSVSRPGAAIAAPPLGAVASERGSTVWLDLSPGTSARLLLLTYLRDADAPGEIQISTDGIHWQTIHTVLPSEDWNALDLDLTAWLGQRIRLRLVIRKF